MAGVERMQTEHPEAEVDLEDRVDQGQRQVAHRDGRRRDQGRAAPVGREGRHSAAQHEAEDETDQGGPEGPDQELVLDRLRKELHREEQVAERHQREIRESRDRGGQRERQPPLPATPVVGRRHRVVQPGEQGQGQQALERPEQQQHEAHEADGRADVLPQPDLLGRRQGIGLAGQGLLQPVHGAADARAAEVLPRVGHRRVFQNARRASSMAKGDCISRVLM